MDLLNSVRQQRELFSQTLSSADMPRRLHLDGDENEKNDLTTHIQRPALSPRNKKAGVEDARQLVSSLRSKRENLLKRYESASTHGDNDQENIVSANRKAVVDMSWLNEEAQVEEERTGVDTGVSGHAEIDYTKFETKKTTLRLISRDRH